MEVVSRIAALSKPTPMQICHGPSLIHPRRYTVLLHTPAAQHSPNIHLRPVRAKEMLDISLEITNSAYLSHLIISPPLRTQRTYKRWLTRNPLYKYGCPLVSECHANAAATGTTGYAERILYPGWLSHCTGTRRRSRLAAAAAAHSVFRGYLSTNLLLVSCALHRTSAPLRVRLKLLWTGHLPTARPINEVSCAALYGMYWVLRSSESLEVALSRERRCAPSL